VWRWSRRRKKKRSLHQLPRGRLGLGRRACAAQTSLRFCHWRYLASIPAISINLTFDVYGDSLIIVHCLRGSGHLVWNTTAKPDRQSQRDFNRYMVIDNIHQDVSQRKYRRVLIETSISVQLPSIRHRRNVGAQNIHTFRKKKKNTRGQTPSPRLLQNTREKNHIQT
jgi:hypothetical protein